MSQKVCLRRGEKSIKMNWHNELKVALINKDSARADFLIENLPRFQNLEEMLQAKELISQLIDFLESQKQETKDQMIKIKAAKEFIGN